MCGIVGILSQSPIIDTLISALKGLQHRGQQASGIATLENNLMHLKKGLGLVKEVITKNDISYLKGNIGIGHVRYPTAGDANDPEQSHPFYVNSPFGIMLAHNGNLTNTSSLRNDLLTKNHRHVRTMSDSEILTNIFAFELEQLTTNSELNNNKIFEAIKSLNNRINGAYAVVSLIANFGLVAFRDPFGIRPLIIGEKIIDGNKTYLIASESSALEINGFNIIRDILPGESVIISKDGNIEYKICHPNPKLNICIFEYVYMARSDSIIEKVLVQNSRRNMGKYLANKIAKLNLSIDIVIPIPDTARTIAIEVANVLNKPYREGFVKNHFTERTFMLSDSKEREIAVRNKLNPIKAEFFEKNILIIDDSIVRGTTSKEIIHMVKKCGANLVFIATAAPKFMYPNVYGIDMPHQQELIAYNKTDEEIANILLADQVIYMDLIDLKRSITDENPELVNFDASCFDGKYITGQIDNNYINNLETVAWMN
jgi:amidophosphoribosyltransferase